MPEWIWAASCSVCKTDQNKRTNTFAERSLRALSLKFELALVRDLMDAPKNVFVNARQNATLRLESSRILKHNEFLSDVGLA